MSHGPMSIKFESRGRGRGSCHLYISINPIQVCVSISSADASRMSIIVPEITRCLSLHIVSERAQYS